MLSIFLILFPKLNVFIYENQTQQRTLINHFSYIYTKEKPYTMRHGSLIMNWWIRGRPHVFITFRIFSSKVKCLIFYLVLWSCALTITFHIATWIKNQFLKIKIKTENQSILDSKSKPSSLIIRHNKSYIKMYIEGILKASIYKTLHWKLIIIYSNIIIHKQHHIWTSVYYWID